MAENRVIGRLNALPWHLPADLQRFKTLTTGHAVIMGRKTFDAIGRVLPDRRIIVLTRNRAWSREGVEVLRGLEAALARCPATDEVFVAGGAEVFRQALASAARVYLTVVHATIAGDAHFPRLDPADWSLAENERHVADQRHAFDYSFRRYERVRGAENEGNGET